MTSGLICLPCACRIGSENLPFSFPVIMSEIMALQMNCPCSECAALCPSIHYLRNFYYYYYYYNSIVIKNI